MDFEEVLKSTILEALIEKVTNAQNANINHPAINAFSKIITDEPESASLAIQLIICKIQSPKEWEVMQILNLLEMCMENSSGPLLAEVGKFRFLNEMIKLVSPKYLGNNTPAAIRNKIVDLLKSWSFKYPKETKIKEAYEMLVKLGVVKSETVTQPSFSNLGPTNSSRSSLYEDDVEKSQMLQKLLRSNKPDDLKAANLLIKTMVKEKEEKEDLKLIENNTKLLSEMLSNLNPDSSLEDFQLIRELKETCVNMKPTLTYMISTSNKTSKDSAELFDINDFLNDTLLYYHQVMFEKKILTNSVPVQPVREPPRVNDHHFAEFSPPTLLDFGSLIDDDSLILSTEAAKSNNRTNLLKSEPSETRTRESSVDTLKDIFSSTFNVSDKGENYLDKPDSTERKPINSTKLFQDLNALGKSLLETPNLEDANTKDITKVTLNDLVAKTNGENLSETYESTSSDEPLLGDLDELVNGDDKSRPEAHASKLDRNEKITNDVAIVTTPDESSASLEPLSDVFVPLMHIKTEDDEKLTAFQDPAGITVFIQLAKNKPREDVSVFLVLSNSRKSEVLSNYLFQPVVSKDCRMKLQPPSKTELPPYNPHIPMDTIVQIMLIASLKKDYIPLKFVISYVIQNEMMTEMGEVPRLPLK